MKIKIYRGTHQIGGCVTEITTAKTRIIIDFGTQLPNAQGEIPPEHLEIEGVTFPGNLCDAVIFTHYHGDHAGRIAKLLTQIPTYIGKASKEILLLQQKQKKSNVVPRIEKINEYYDGKPFDVGDLRITPIIADHSAFDAHMLLIQGEGKTVLHTGDFRDHGYRRDLMLSALEQITGKVDVLITEGTNLSAENPAVFPERRLSEAAKILISRYKYVFVMCGATDIDRLLSFYNGSAGRPFLCNEYQAGLLAVAGKYDGSTYNFNDVKVYDEEKKYARFSMIVGKGKDFQRIMTSYTEDNVEQCLFIYSMPESYFKQNKSELERIMDGFRYCTKLHTSGHGSVEAIWQVANIIKPEQAVIPIHTTAPERIRLGALQDKVVYLEDGDEYTI